MPAIIEPLYVNDLVREYLSGKSGTQIARERGHDYNTVRQWLLSRGILRSRSQAEILKRGLDSRLDVNDLAAQYASGKTLDEIASESGASRGGIKGLFIRNGVRIRTKSEGIAIGWQRGRRNPRAHAWNKGVSQTLSQRIKKAETVFRNSSYIGRHEPEIFETMKTLGIVAEKQFPVGPYNIDIAIPENAIAVEVQVGNVAAKYTSIRRERLEYLIGKGWRVIILFCWQNQRFDISAVAENAVATIKLLRSDPTVIGQYGVIGRDGCQSTIPGFDTDGWTAIQIPEPNRKIP